jgi:hypothetical protein
VVYDPVIHGKRYEFGVSGRLYMRNLLLFDRETGSLWSQLLSEAVTGPLAGTRLKMLPAENTSWALWQHEHPGTLVLSFKTGFLWNYRKNPYAWLGPPPEQALVVSAREEAKLYPFSVLRRTRGPVFDQLGGRKVEVVYDRRSGMVRVNGGGVRWYTASYAVLKRFYPYAKVYP